MNNPNNINNPNQKDTRETLIRWGLIFCGAVILSIIAIVHSCNKHSKDPAPAQQAAPAKQKPKTPPKPDPVPAEDQDNSRERTYIAVEKGYKDRSPSGGDQYVIQVFRRGSDFEEIAYAIIESGNLMVSPDGNSFMVSMEKGVLKIGPGSIQYKGGMF